MDGRCEIATMKKILFTIFFYLISIKLIFCQDKNFYTSFNIQYKKYNEVCFPTTHNSFNYLIGPKQYIYPNQRYDIPKQLADGIRGFMIDIHDHDKIVPIKGNKVLVFHEQAVLGHEPLENILDYFNDFLADNTEEIVTIIFDCDVSDSKKVASIFEKHAIYKFLYHHNDSIGWPTLDQMIRSNQRCVVFSHCSGYSDWYLHQNNYCFENDYNNHNITDYKGKVIRGDTTKNIFIMNHFLYNPLQRKKVNKYTNQYDGLMNHITICKNTTGKYPNFLTVDWYDKGALFRVVNELNSR